MDTKGKKLFEEQQQFRARWAWWILFISMAAALAGILLTVLKVSKEEPALWWVLALVVLLESVLVYLFFITRFETVVTTEGIQFRWWPFQRNGWFIPRDEIESARFRKPPGMNIGYNWIPGYGRMHNLSGG